MKLQTIADCEEKLRTLTYGSSQINKKGFTTHRTQLLADAVGNPEKTLRVVHLAGTSGKTSTSYFVAALLHASGKKVGLTVSPHIESITERAQINGMSLPEDRYIEYFAEFIDMVERSNVHPSYYECTLVFALWVFEREQVDYAVVETGLGGLYDSSNICTRQDKLCILTDIGFDHQQFLGNTLAKIASQKAGIIWPGNHVVMYEQSEEVMQVVRERVAEQQAELQVLKSPETDETSAIATFQQRNWQLAHQAFLWLQTRDSLPEITPDNLADTQQVQVPARMEEFTTGTKTILIDGAHNEQKMRTFFDSFAKKYGKDAKPVVILSLKEGKDLEAIAPMVAGHASRVIATRFADSQDLPFGPQPPVDIAEAMSKLGIASQVAPTMATAIESFVNSEDTFCLIVGSLHSAAEARAIVKA